MSTQVSAEASVKYSSSIITHGSANFATKGEDVVGHRQEDDRFAFALFDGHGGVEAAKICKAELLPMLCTLTEPEFLGADAFPSKDIVDKFWDMDDSLGTREIFSGTTASILLLSPVASNELSQSCTLCWVGDSQCITVNMRSADTLDALISSTSIHTPSNESEKVRQPAPDLPTMASCQLTALTAPSHPAIQIPRARILSQNLVTSHRRALN
ncbi:MAG: hypothetical protein SGPRY_008992 [Prymnesium sp.]